MESPFEIVVGDTAITLAPEEDPAIAIECLKELAGQPVTGSAISETGRLTVVFQSGISLVAEPDPRYEAWTITGPGGLIIVCLPGGQLSVWNADTEGSDPSRSPNADVKFPAMRKETLTALAALADREYQQRVWIERKYPREGFYDDLTMNVNVLYDMVLPDPKRRVGIILRDEAEVKQLTALADVLGPLVDDLREAPDHRYLADQRWDAVVAAAASALSVMSAEY